MYLEGQTNIVKQIDIHAYHIIKHMASLDPKQVAS